MNIRLRMVRRTISFATAGGLCAAAFVHGAWAQGSTWPDTFAATYGGKRAPVRRLARWGSISTAGALLARGVAGFVVSGTGVVATTPQFRRRDLRLYSPLCLAIGAGAATIARPPPDESPAVAAMPSAGAATRSAASPGDAPLQ